MEVDASRVVFASMGFHGGFRGSDKNSMEMSVDMTWAEVAKVASSVLPHVFTPTLT